MSGQVTQTECIQTNRLELKSYKISDKEQLIKLLTNTEVTKTFMVPEFKSLKQVLDLVCKLIEFSKAEDTTHLEYGIYLNGTLIGFINDCGFDDEENKVAELCTNAVLGNISDAHKVTSGMGSLIFFLLSAH